MQQTDKPSPTDRHRPRRTFHATVLPRVMNRVSVGTFRVKGGLPQFEVSCDQADKESLAYHPVELVDIKNMTYELVYNCQNFGTTPIDIAITWVDGQLPQHA